MANDDASDLLLCFRILVMFYTWDGSVRASASDLATAHTAGIPLEHRCVHSVRVLICPRTPLTRAPPLPRRQPLRPHHLRAPSGVSGSPPRGRWRRRCGACSAETTFHVARPPELPSLPSLNWCVCGCVCANTSEWRVTYYLSGLNLHGLEADSFESSDKNPLWCSRIGVYGQQTKWSYG